MASSALLQGASKFLIDRKRAAKKLIFDAARAEASGKKGPDPAELAEALERSAISEERFLEMVDVLRRVAPLRDAAGKRAGAEKQVHACGLSLQEYLVETGRLVAERRKGEEQLRIELEKAKAELDRAEKAQAQVDLIEGEHGELLGLAIDLDEFVLYATTANGANRGINVFEPGSPRRQVTLGVLERERERRAKLMAEARAEAEAKHRAAYEVWRARQKTKIDGAGTLVILWSASDPAPRYIDPSWADVVKAAKRCAS